jgi:soluble lytic murein transglycosylase
LLPSVGQKLAKQMKIRPYSTSLLLDPEANIKLGTRFFRQMVDDNGGRVEYALAAYNAGQNRVRDWQASGNFRDTAEFVESIPFTETRDYVQAIMRNVNLYKQLYAGSELASSTEAPPAAMSAVHQ